jgi:hypothetical protein
MLIPGAVRLLAVGGGPAMTNTYPAFCSVCGCPIQLLAAGHDGQTTGTIEDALNRHADVVHPERRPNL